jgi:hypothetical protein
MKKDDLYTQWIEHRRQVAVSEDLVAGVMARIESRTSCPDQNLPLETIFLPSRLLRWSAAAGLVLLGLFRIIYIAASLLRPHLLMP